MVLVFTNHSRFAVFVSVGVEKVVATLFKKPTHGSVETI